MLWFTRWMACWVISVPPGAECKGHIHTVFCFIWLSILILAVFILVSFWLLFIFPTERLLRRWEKYYHWLYRRESPQSDLLIHIEWLSVLSHSVGGCFTVWLRCSCSSISLLAFSLQISSIQKYLSIILEQHWIKSQQATWRTFIQWWRVTSIICSSISSVSVFQ